MTPLTRRLLVVVVCCHLTVPVMLVGLGVVNDLETSRVLSPVLHGPQHVSELGGGPPTSKQQSQRGFVSLLQVWRVRIVCIWRDAGVCRSGSEQSGRGG